ncbi:MAG TPA: translocation/assembly module TamB domain-containing protein [Pyrinomonadaceae bacterium]|jgi:translocation and assembly module TamB
MPVDDRDEPSSGTPPERQEEATEKVLQSETDKPLPPAAERAAERDADRPEPLTPQGQRRRWVTRRNALIATIAVAAGLFLLVLLIITAYKLGFIDRYVANQIKTTLATYGIRAEIKEFHTAISPRTVEMRGIELYDAKTGERIGRIERMLATVRVEDLYALRLRRNVNLESLVIDNPEFWVTYDAEGNSNFRNLHLPPPEPNKRLLFSYSTALIKINGGLVHYGDAQHELSGEARNLALNIQPDDPNAPAASWMNTVVFSSTNSTLTYDGRPAINNIEINARGRVNQTRAEIQELTLRSPLAEAHLSGTMDDWRNLRYQLQAKATIDLTQASDVLQAGATLRGVGSFEGTVSGEGDRYQLDGQIKSDALAADNVRLRALNVTARGSGQGKNYDLNGRAVAELLTVGDFQLNMVQLAGGVMGTGTDFRFLGELRSASLRYTNSTSVSGLILSDVMAESRENTLVARMGRAFAASVNSSGASLGGVRLSNVQLRSENQVTKGTAQSVQAETVTASGTRVNGLTATGVDFTSRDGTTNVTSDNLRVGGINARGAQIGSLNIAGVRLAIRDGRVQGSTADFNVGTVNIAEGKSAGGLPPGHLDNLRVARLAFTVEPSGSYRASADLSLGGGVLGEVNLGAARANVVASNSQIQVNNFNAEVMGGSARGNAVVSLARRGSSHVSAEFSNLDVGKLVSLLSGRAMPVAGQATGTADLRFPETDLTQASGNARISFTAETGDDASGRTPLNGEVALRADRGLFNIERANLRTAASELTATGQFSFESANSNLQINLASSDAAELQRVLATSGLLPDVEEQLNTYGVELAGNLSFNGTLRGKLTEPEINGRVSLDSLILNGQDVGSLTASINSTATELRVPDGRLTERDGGGVQFDLTVPRLGKDNITLNATLERVNGQNLVAILSNFSRGRIDNPSPVPDLSTVSLRSDLSGSINITGLPGAMNGKADLRFGPGSLNNEPFESISARATFSGPDVNLETVDARFTAGHVTANGTLNTETKAFNLEGRAENVLLDRLASFSGTTRGLPKLTGTASLNARAKGIFTDFSTYEVNFDGEGREVTINGRPAGELTLVGRTENRQLNITFRTGLLGQPQVIAANIDLSKEQLPTTIETTLAGVDLAPLFAAILPPGTNVRVSGRATGSLRASGNLFAENAEGENVFGLAGLRGRAEFTELTVEVEDIPLTAVSPMLVQFSTNEVFFEKTAFKGPDTDLVFGGTAALGAGGKQNLTVDGRLNLRVLNSLSPDIFSSGIAEAHVRVGGTYEDPRITGTASVAGASISTLIADERLTVSNVNGRVRFNANQAQIDTLTGNLGGGRVALTGGVLLDGFTLSRFVVNVTADNVVVPFPQDFRSTADANLEIKGTQRQQIISGTVNLRRSEYTQDIELADIINRRREASLTEGTGDSTFATTTIFDRLRVVGRDALVVRNNLADIVGSVALEVNGPVEDPIISGRITATRGTLTFRNDRYELTRAFIDLPAQRDADPLLNIQAESEIRGYRVIVGLTGPLSQPNAVVRSDPALPQADVVALVTTGDLAMDSTSQSTIGQSAIGTATSLLTDTLINAPARRATDRLFGLNRFEIDPLITGRGGSSPTARLTVGRQINRNLSITYSTNLTSDQNQVIAVEYRVSNRLSFVAQYQQGSVSGFQSRNDNFSFEIRFHKRF